MLFFKGKEDMGLEASLKLLDLSPDATIDDANQAYAYLHQMVDLFHQDGGDKDRGTRQEDMDLLTCAYEKAVAYISDQAPVDAASEAGASRSSIVDAPEATDLHFTINFSGDTDRISSNGADPRLPEPNNQTVVEAISITARRLKQTESDLPGVQDAVASATAAADEAIRRHERSKQARMDAIVNAKSAKSRALLLEIEAKRAMDDAIAVAAKARDRVVAARQAASDARVEADKARNKAVRIEKSEETAAAEVVCAEDRLEKEKARLKALTHTLLQTRNRMKLFQGSRTETSRSAVHPTVMPENRSLCMSATGPQADDRQQIMSDLMEIEASLKSRKQVPPEAQIPEVVQPENSGTAAERRRHDRIAYPSGQGPAFSIDGRTIPVLDLSSAGMRLEPDDAMACQRIVRGAIAFGGRQPVAVTGKVVRQDDHGLGLKLVTRIGNHILDQERKRLIA